MDDEETWLGIELDFWDDNVGAFEPIKVIRQLELAFPAAEIDPTDYQQVRLLRELGFWEQSSSPPETRKTLISQSWGLYRTTGPTYKFVIPFSSGERIKGSARRLSVGFWLPPDATRECREQLTSFLRSLRMGDLKLCDDEIQSAEPPDGCDPAVVV